MPPPGGAGLLTKKTLNLLFSDPGLPWHLFLYAVRYLHLDRVLVYRDDLAVDAARGDDIIALLEGGHHGPVLLGPLLLRPYEEEVEYYEKDDERGYAHQAREPGRGRGCVLGVCNGDWKEKH